MTLMKLLWKMDLSFNILLDLIFLLYLYYLYIKYVYKKNTS